MRALVQRVSSGGVKIPSENYTKSIKKGLVILLGVAENDSSHDVVFVADKCCNLRIFEDENEKMNLSLKDIKGEVLVISQFTLYGDTRKGNRPSFSNAARPELAEKYYEEFVSRMKINLGESKVKTGIFATMMQVEINNDGPVTLLVESKQKVEN
ncbi:MAG: D-tyrosyl-tRNA(Tyr) deacylase [Melioribacteraceae bacterium]|nr:D-tyrosyl-tRNA(Tyr) deacylase [Melioribacteraceae bacterium]MCF8264278.1 D-tyrosyl-tRNA(Tyr) deacylase [Melioribacteraceae bacterium]MCF8412690.1 D-tyrosyl-tRNA(Tyr) deacylase [Melioribacteraceae bacterium]